MDLVPGPGINVFIGANGQGKTNLLEAVAMLALSSSPRSRRELELVGPVAPVARIEGEVETAGLTAELAITLTVAVASTLCAGLYPTWRASRVQPAWQLKLQ